MNEYLGRNRPFGAGFSDVFSDPKDRDVYHDTQLSPLGIRQAKALQFSQPSFCKNVDLVVTSPLRRALQTIDLGLRSQLAEDTRIIAHPAAAERLYFVSDLGSPVDKLRKESPWCDFSTHLNSADEGSDSIWWWQHSDEKDGPYQEWRPTGKGQRYACKSEPQTAYDARMSRLYEFLGSLPDQRIAVVCHHGVIEWMLDMDFDNCQYRTVEWNKIQPNKISKKDSLS